MTMKSTSSSNILKSSIFQLAFLSVQIFTLASCLELPSITDSASATLTEGDFPEAPMCGNDKVEEGEQCDKGNDIIENWEYASCDIYTCQHKAFCGNGVIEDILGGEECDLGKVSPDKWIASGCDENTCKWLPTTGAQCGNGNKEGDEQCDAGIKNGLPAESDCRSDCTLVLCGDGIVDTKWEEECDDGDKNGNPDESNCRSTNCQIVVCGDGIEDKEWGEQCDKGNNPAPVWENAGCDPATCELVDTSTTTGTDEFEIVTITGSDTDPSRGMCGDGVLEGSEECDDGNNLDNDGCSSICKEEKCGDGIVQANEMCDDKEGTPAYMNDDDGCTKGCKTPSCGDGYYSPMTVPEDCDWVLHILECNMDCTCKQEAIDNKTCPPNE